MGDNHSATRDPRLLRTLQYFEAVARLGSVKAAAEECSVSASAISHQLRELKNYLGEEVFVASGRSIRLTETGEQLFLHVSRMFANLDRVLEDTVGRTKPLLRLAVCSSFGPAWLAKRLPDFIHRQPAIDVEVHLFSKDPLQTEKTADVIVTADDVEAGFEAVTLFEEMLVAVCSPDASRNADGMPLQLITTDLVRGKVAEDWRDFSDTVGQDYLGTAQGGLVRCTHYLLAMAMAQAGVGAALVPDFLAGDALERGELVLLTPQMLPAGRIYKACYKTSRARDPAISSLVRWIRGQADTGGSATTRAAVHPKVLTIVTG